MTASLPDSLLVLERGWLSANNILCFDGDRATLVDSGYVTHAAQTVDLVAQALAGRQLERVINTHSHSDHIGGNAALKAATPRSRRLSTAGSSFPPACTPLLPTGTRTRCCSRRSASRPPASSTTR